MVILAPLNWPMRILLWKPVLKSAQIKGNMQTRQPTNLTNTATVRMGCLMPLMKGKQLGFVRVGVECLLPVGVVVAASGVGVECLVPIGVVVVSSGVGVECSVPVGVVVVSSGVGVECLVPAGVVVAASGNKHSTTANNEVCRTANDASNCPSSFVVEVSSRWSYFNEA